MMFVMIALRWVQHCLKLVVRDLLGTDTRARGVCDI